MTMPRLRSQVKAFGQIVFYLQDLGAAEVESASARRSRSGSIAETRRARTADRSVGRPGP